jgi:hypothetical protein
MHVAAVALLLPFASAAMAGDRQSALDECGALSQAGMRECLAKKAAESQASLKRAENDAAAALARWDEDAKYATLAKAKLDLADRMFAQYRDAECTFATSLGGGAIGTALAMRQLSCTIALNNERAARLAKSVGDLPRR